MPLSEDEVNQAAKRLAFDSRSLLGLPVEPSGSQWAQHLASPPNAVEFSRIVSRHVPLLIDNCINDRKCTERWMEASYLVDKMGTRKIEVTLTPNGRADDVYVGPDGKDVFVLPHTIQINMEELLARFCDETPIAYLQSQNSNLTENTGAGDLSPLLEDLISTDSMGEKKSSLLWADEALGKAPEATNLWIGTDKSKTSMHRDHYENLFSVIRGAKIFTLYPPSEAHFLCDDEVYSVYQWKTKDELKWELEESKSPPTPWIPIDPTEPPSSARNVRYPRYSQALPSLKIEVHEGETLYLPAGWYHHVAQRGDDREGLCICVNWWYESEITFSDRWALEAFVKEIGQAVRK